MANIKIDVGKQINRYNTKPEDTETYFGLALEKWVDFNYTGLFCNYIFIQFIKYLQILEIF